MPAFRDIIRLLPEGYDDGVPWPFTVDGSAVDGLQLRAVNLDPNGNSHGNDGATAAALPGAYGFPVELQTKDGSRVTGTIGGEIPAGRVIGIGEVAATLSHPLNFDALSVPIGRFYSRFRGRAYEYYLIDGQDPEAAFRLMSALYGLPCTFAGDSTYSGLYVWDTIGFENGLTDLGSARRGYQVLPEGRGFRFASSRLPQTLLTVLATAGLGQALSFLRTDAPLEGATANGQPVTLAGAGPGTPIWCELLSQNTAEQLAIDSGGGVEASDTQTAVWLGENLPFDPNAVIDGDGDIWRVTGVETEEGPRRARRIVATRREGGAGG